MFLLCFFEAIFLVSFPYSFLMSSIHLLMTESHVVSRAESGLEKKIYKLYKNKYYHPRNLTDTFTAGSFFTLLLKPQNSVSVSPDERTFVECLLIMPQAVRNQGTEKGIRFITFRDPSPSTSMKEEYFSYPIIF